MVAHQIPRMAILAKDPQFTAEEIRKFRDGSDDLLNHLCQIF